LTRKVTLFQGSEGESVVIHGPVVGTHLLAFARRRALRVLLDRRDLSVRWEGDIPEVEPVRWHGEDLHVLDERGLYQVWDPLRGSKRWEAGAAWGHHLWNGHVVVLPSTDRLEIREPRDGTILQAHGLPRPVDAVRIVGDVCVAQTVDRRLAAFGLPGLVPLWEIELGPRFSGVAAGNADPIWMVHGDESLVVIWAPEIGLVDVSDGRLCWVEPLLLAQTVPLLSHGRVSMFSGGELHVMDAATGATLVHEHGIAPTLWERPPIAWRDRMVVTDQKGFIVTVALPEGRVLGVQNEKGRSFAGGAMVDDRLLMKGFDGALWVYEPSATEEEESARQPPKPGAPRASNPAARPKRPAPRVVKRR
jgi:hypothetical protein